MTATVDCEPRMHVCLVSYRRERIARVTLLKSGSGSLRPASRVNGAALSSQRELFPPPALETQMHRRVPTPQRIIFMTVLWGASCLIASAYIFANAS